MNAHSLASSTMVLLLLSCAPDCVARPANDDCGVPEAISGYGTFAFDTTIATTNPLALACGAGDAANDVWYCWTAPESGPVTVDLCAGDVVHDTLIAVYAGCLCPEPNSEIACNDDACGLQSRVGFFAEGGATYLIRIGGFSEGSAGSGTFRTASGIIHTVVGARTYHLFSALTWTSAEEIAVALGGHLVTINDAAENELVRFDVLGFDGADRRAWIGLNDANNEGTFEWSSGEPVTFTNWNTGEPNDFEGNEDYAEILGSSGQWNDQPDDGNAFVQFGVAEVTGVPKCDADFNGDKVVNSQDFFDFLTAFFANDPSADFNDDSLINSQDFFDFLTAFFEGC